MAGSKATKFQEQAATYFYGASKTEQIPKWNCPWTQVEIGESRRRALKAWVGKMQNVQKRQQPKSM